MWPVLVLNIWLNYRPYATWTFGPLRSVDRWSTDARPERSSSLPFSSVTPVSNWFPNIWLDYKFSICVKHRWRTRVSSICRVSFSPAWPDSLHRSLRFRYENVTKIESQFDSFISVDLRSVEGTTHCFAARARTSVSFLLLGKITSTARMRHPLYWRLVETIPTRSVNTQPHICLSVRWQKFFFVEESRSVVRCSSDLWMCAFSPNSSCTCLCCCCCSLIIFFFFLDAFRKAIDRPRISSPYIGFHSFSFFIFQCAFIDLCRCLLFCFHFEVKSARGKAFLSLNNRMNVSIRFLSRWEFGVFKHLSNRN